MKCYKCNKEMKEKSGIHFNQHSVDGWVCSCGETYLDPSQIQQILLLNKLKKEIQKAKLGKMRSNIIVRVPLDVEHGLGLQKGEQIVLKIKGKELYILPA